MKIQRILQAQKTEEDGWVHQIVFAFTSRREYVTWTYRPDTKYSGGHYHTTFADGFAEFQKRVEETFGENWPIEYCTRQLGQSEIVWELE